MAKAYEISYLPIDGLITAYKAQLKSNHNSQGGPLSSDSCWLGGHWEGKGGASCLHTFPQKKSFAGKARKDAFQ